MTLAERTRTRQELAAGVTTLRELEVIRAAIEKSPHATISLSRERVLRFIDLAMETVKAREVSTER